MKTILMIVYSWPPRGGIGMLRPLKFAKYLPEFGWDPIILTPKKVPSSVYCDESIGKLPGVKVIKSDYIDTIEKVKLKLGIKYRRINENTIKKYDEIKFSTKKKLILHFKKFVRDLLSIPDEFSGWYKPAVKTGMEIIKQEKINLIYSTSPPETSHLIAFKLKQETNLPWVADLRDPWGTYRLEKKITIKNIINKILEIKTLRYADKLITVSKPWKEMMESYLKKEVEVITNGFDDEDFKGIYPKFSDKFIITYTGKLYNTHQNPEILLKVISNLIKEKKIDPKKLEINFYVYGNDQPDFENLSKKYNLEGIMYYRDQIPYNECLKKQMESTILPIFNWMDTGNIGKGTIPGKVYEYMGAKRPILIVRSNSGMLEEIIKETNSGKIGSNEQELKKILLDWYKEFINTGRLSYTGYEDKIKNYTRRNLTKSLSNILNLL